MSEWQVEMVDSVIEVIMSDCYGDGYNDHLCTNIRERRVSE